MSYHQLNKYKRQKLISGSNLKHALRYGPKIDDLGKLKQLLREAIQLEHFTIPPYLCALYSLEDGKLGPNQEAYGIILSVVMEEMLHMVMAANILNAIGGTPSIYNKDFVLGYPTLMPHSAEGFEVGLLKFSKEAVNTFLRIERPAERTDKTNTDQFWSIGEFYAAVRQALNDLDNEAWEHGNEKGIFTGDKERQVTKEHYYGGGGELVAVYSLEDANRAIDEIVGQGEGIDGTIKDGDDLFGEDMELAHYFRFNEIFCERSYQSGDKPNASPTGAELKVDWNAVYNMVPNPSLAKFKKLPAVFKQAQAFSRTYTQLLQNIEQACTGTPEVMNDGVPLMHSLRNQAIELMNVDSGECDCTAGPCFEFLP